MLLAQRIIRERGRLGWSKADLARKAGLKPSYVTRIEKAQFDHPSLEKVQAIANALNIDLTSLTEPPIDSAEDDALLRKLIERRIGNRGTADIVTAFLDRVKGRPLADQKTALDVLEVLTKSFDARLD